MSTFTVVEEQGVAVVTIDQPGSPVNILTAAVKAEFESLLERLRADKSVRAVLLMSGKPDGFIAGADIEQFVALPNQAAAEALSRDGQATMDRLAAFPKPIVVAIHGACLGGGLELVLACDWRIATDSPKTQLGLPEVQIGLLPGAGGYLLARLGHLPSTGEHMESDGYRFEIVDMDKSKIDKVLVRKMMNDE